MYLNWNSDLVNQCVLYDEASDIFCILEFCREVQPKVPYLQFSVKHKILSQITHCVI